MLYHAPNFRLLDPTGITEGVAVAGIVAAVASAGVGMAAAHQQAQEQTAADNYNAQVQANNAQVAAWQRQQQEQEFAAQSLITRQEGAQTSSDLELRNNVLVARNIAAAASSGLQISGSTADTISGSAANNELEVLTNQHRTALEAYQNEIGASTASYNALTQERAYDAQSQLDTFEGQGAQETGLFSEVGAGIGGVSSLGTVLSSPSNQAALKSLFD